MDSQKLQYEQKMVDEAAAAGFCIPPREKRHEFYGRTPQIPKNGLKGTPLHFKKITDEQRALEEAEAAGFCVQRSALSRKSFNSTCTSGWDRNIHREADFGGGRFTPCEVWRGSGDATTEISNTTSRSRSNGEEDDEEEEACPRDLSEDSLLRGTLESNRSTNISSLGPSVAVQTSLCSRHPSFHTSSHSEVLSREAPSLQDKQPGTPEDGSSSKPWEWTTMNVILAVVFLVGLILFTLAEIMFQKYCCRGRPLPKKAKASLLRLIIDDIVFVAMRNLYDVDALSG